MLKLMSDSLKYNLGWIWVKKTQVPADVPHMLIATFEHVSAMRDESQNPPKTSFACQTTEWTDTVISHYEFYILKWTID